MPEYGFSQTRIFPYKRRDLDSILILENGGQRKPVFSHILRSALMELFMARSKIRLYTFQLLNVCFIFILNF